MWPLNIRVLPPPVPARCRGRWGGPPRPPATGPAGPSRGSLRHVLGHRLLSPVKLGLETARSPSRRAGRGRRSPPHRREHPLSESLSCPSRSSPQSSSITWVQPASRYSWIAAMQSSGVPAIGLHLSRISSVTAAFAASARPPPSPPRPAGSRPGSAPRIRAACRPQPGCSAPCSRGTCLRSRARRRGPGRGPRRSRRRSCSRDRGIGIAARRLELAAHVADERGRRDRGGRQPVGRLRGGAQHHRPGAREVERHVPARRVGVVLQRRNVRREDLAVEVERLAGEHARTISAASFIAATGFDSTFACRMKIFETPSPR